MIRKSLPFITIIIPIIGYKVLPSYLTESLSILAYPKDKFEVFFVKLADQRITPAHIGIKIEFINNKEIIGYSQAINVGVKNGKGKLMFVINPDIKLDKYTLKKLVEYFLIDRQVAVAGPIVFGLNEPSNISLVDLPVVNFKKLHGKLNPLSPKQLESFKKPVEVDWLSGCAFLFSRKIWKDLGGFEEKLFIYWEDADFCMRAKEKGQKVILVPSAKVWHEGSVFMKSQNFNKLYYLVRNGKYFINRHADLWGIIILHINNFFMLIIKGFQIIIRPDTRIESYTVMSGIIDFYFGKWGRKK